MPKRAKTVQLSTDVASPEQSPFSAIHKNQYQENAVIEQLFTVFGDSGTQRYSGYINEEQNADWRDASRIDTVEEMRRGDGAIQAVLKAIKAPILSADFTIWSADETPKGEEIRANVEKNVMGMQRQFKEFLRESLGFFDFGHYVFEIIYGIDSDGMICLKDLAPRIPRSIMKWKMQSSNCPGITQLISTDDNPKTLAEIPMEKLFVLTNDQEGDDLTGRSVLRSAYIHWKHKRLLYIISGISADRYGVGVPVMKLPEGYSDAEKAAAEELLKNLRSNERSYLVLPPKFEVDILTPQGSNNVTQNMQVMMDHHNKMITLSVLAQFLLLGSDGVGSYALSGDLSSFFLRHVEDRVHYWRNAFNTQVIRRFVDLNYGPQKIYPEIRNTPISERNMKEYSETLKNLVDSGLLDIDTDLKQELRSSFKLPKLTDKQVNDGYAEDDGSQQEDSITEDDSAEMSEHFNRVMLTEQKLSITRKLTMQEKRVDFQQLNEDFNNLQTQFEDSMSGMTSDEIERYVASLQKKLDAGDIAGIAAMGLMIAGATKKAISKAMFTAYQKGKTTAASEMGVDRPITPQQTTQVMNMDVDDMTNNYINNIDQKAKDVVKNSIVAGAATGAIVVAVKQAMKDEAAKTISNISGTIVDQYINRGRNAVFQANISKIVSFQRSEVLDNVTCGTCLELDQKTIYPHDPMAYLDQVHTNCRGIWVPIYEDDTEQPEITGLSKKMLDSFDTVDGRPMINAFTQMKRPTNQSTESTKNAVRKSL